jgi:uncharacterized protein (TIGR03905 family)
MRKEYKTSGTCSSQINIEIDDNGIIQEVEFIGGCNGNTKGISKLVKGRKAKEVADILRGTQCGMRGTSCPDQLAKAIDEMSE